MNRPLLNSLLASLLFIVAACASTAQQAPQASAPPDTTVRKPAVATMPPLPAEDVTKYRPVFAAPKAPSATTAAAPTRTAVLPTNQVNAPVDQRLRDQAYTNQNVKYAQGYRILVYFGTERDQVMALRRAIIGRYPDETDYIVFKSPVYRLYIGDYLTRLDAARGLARLRPFAPKPELEPTQVLLNKNP